MGRRFTVIHPFHPLFEQEFELIRLVHNWHEDRVQFRVDDTSRIDTLPLSWTSLAPGDPFRVCSAGRAWFRVEDLGCLVELLVAASQQLAEGGDGDDV